MNSNEYYLNNSLINIEGEIWKDIKGYEGLYQISNKGRIKALEKISTIKSNNSFNGSKRVWSEHILQSQLQKDGYIKACLYKDNKRKTVKVHRLVAEAFIDNPDNLPLVNHKDECKSNNNVENLEWCDYSYNVQYSAHKRCIKILCVTTGKIFNSSKEAKAYYGIKDHRGLTSSKYCGKDSEGNKLEWKFLDNTEVND